MARFSLGNLNPIKAIGKAHKWADRQLFGSGPKDTLRPEADAARQEATARGREATGMYFQRASGYDPMASVRETAGGLYDQFEQGARRRIRDLRGSMVGAGRLGGGYGELDEAETLYDAERDLNSRIAGLSLDAENLRFQNMRDIGGFGERQQLLGLDLLSGERDRELDKYNAGQNRRAQFYGTLAKLGMTAATQGRGG